MHCSKDWLLLVVHFISSLQTHIIHKSSHIHQVLGKSTEFLFKKTTKYQLLINNIITKRWKVAPHLTPPPLSVIIANTRVTTYMPSMKCSVTNLRVPITNVRNTYRNNYHNCHNNSCTLYLSIQDELKTNNMLQTFTTHCRSSHTALLDIYYGYGNYVVLTPCKGWSDRTSNVTVLVHAHIYCFMNVHFIHFGPP